MINSLIDIDKLSLALGLDIRVGNVTLRPITLEGIANVGYEVYERYKGIIALNIDDMDLNFLEDIDNMSEEEKEELKTLHILSVNCTFSEEFRKNILETLNFFIKEEVNFVGGVFLIEDKPLEAEEYDEIQKVICKIHKIVKEEKIEAGNELTANFQKQQAIKKKMLEKLIKKVDIPDYVIALIVAGISIEEIRKMTTYQFFAVIEQLKHSKESEYVNQGVMAGNIDVKKLKDKKILDLVIPTVY